MTAKEKAKQLFDKHYFVLFDSESDKGQEVLVTILAKKLAVLTVDEILTSNPTWFIDPVIPTNKYWESVKEHLNNL